MKTPPKEAMKHTPGHHGKCPPVTQKPCSLIPQLLWNGPHSRITALPPACTTRTVQEQLSKCIEREQRWQPCCHLPSDLRCNTVPARPSVYMYSEQPHLAHYCTWSEIAFHCLCKPTLFDGKQAGVHSLRSTGLRSASYFTLFTLICTGKYLHSTIRT